MERVFGRKGEPLKWELFTYLLLVVAAAIGAALLIGQGSLAAYAVVPALLSMITAGIHHDSLRRWRAVAMGIAVTVLAGAGIALSGYAIAAGVAAAVIFWAITAMKAVPEWNIEADLLGLGYFLAVIISIMGEVPAGAAARALLVGALGTLSGLLIVGIHDIIEKMRGRSRPLEKHLAGRPLRERLRAVTDLRNQVVRFAIVRGLVMGLGVGSLVLESDSRNLAWVLIALFAVMRPVHHDTVSQAVIRIVITFMAVVFVGLCAVFLPTGAVLTLAAAAMLAGILFIRRSPLLIAVAGTMLAVAVAGAPGGHIGTWAIARLIDTLIGGFLAVAVIFLLMPVLDRAFGGTEPETVD